MVEQRFGLGEFLVGYQRLETFHQLSDRTQIGALLLLLVNQSLQALHLLLHSTSLILIVLPRRTYLCSRIGQDQDHQDLGDKSHLRIAHKPSILNWLFKGGWHTLST